jgi:outer membrane receptor for ferrienterochelin and colicins
MKLRRTMLVGCLATGLGPWFDAAAEVVQETPLKEVRIVGTLDPVEERRRVSAAKIVYGREDIERFDDATVGEVLRRLPGITYSGPPGVTKDIRVRGLDKGFTQILIDGEPIVGGAKERQIQVDRLPADMIERIELIHNPTADMSADGVGGTVNIVLRKAPAERVARARVGAGRTGPEEVGEANVQYGDRQGKLSYLVNIGVVDRAERLNDTKVGFQASGAVKDRTIESKPADVRELTLAPRLRWDLGGRQSFTLDPFLIAGQEDKHHDVFKFKADGAPNGVQEKAEDKKRVIARLRGEWTQPLAGERQLSLRLTAEQGREEKAMETRDFNAAGALTKTTLQQDEQDEREFAGRIRLSGVAFEHHFWNVGFEAVLKDWETDKSTVENAVLKAPVPSDRFEVRERRAAAFVQNEWRLSRSSVLTPGLRLERIRRASEDGSGAERTGTTSAFNPSLHLLHRWSQATNVRASVARTLRLPKLDDLAPGVDLKAGTLTNPDNGGNPDLRPERAWGLEFGIERFFRRGGVAGVSFFYRDVQDLIERQVVSEGGRFVSRPFNVGDAQLWGAEFDLKSRMDVIGLPGLTLSFNYARLFSEVMTPKVEEKRRIKDQPSYVLNVGLDYELKPYGLAIGANYNYLPAMTNRELTGDGNTKLKFENAKKLLDVYAVQPIGRDFRVRLTVRNVLKDDKFRDETTFRPDGSFNARETRLEESSRTWFVSLEGRW